MSASEESKSGNAQRPADSGPDDYAANFVLLLAFAAVVISLFVFHAGIALAAICLSVIGVGLKIAGAVRHAAGRRL
ncbi:hypothetical protein [Glycomyces arizonensis]|uniref:hypothetical protein n=1 Tax=Glycomyces arizonensis TaxID=256035 RepID=UPI000427F60D|nr:hypothetical protein [Glycomyces arizonensis]